MQVFHCKFFYRWHRMAFCMLMCHFSHFFIWALWKPVCWFSSSVKLLFRFASSLDYLKICKSITCWSLEAVNLKKSLIITSMTNWNWIKFGVGFLLGFQSVLHKRPPCFLGITRVSEPWILLLLLLLVIEPSSVNELSIIYAVCKYYILYC